jgi:hypothetical protein
MLSIHRKKIVFVLICNLIGNLVFAQTKQKFQADYDAKKIHFGYLIGISTTTYVIKYNNSFDPGSNSTQVYQSLTSPVSYALKIGGLVNSRINDYFDIRLLPTIAIYSRKLKEQNKSTGLTTELKFPDKAWFEIPLALKYKSERRRNSRMYMYTGVRAGFETNVVNLVAKSKKTSSYVTKGSDFSIESGFGLELFRQYSKFVPELHFSYGLGNMMTPGPQNLNAFAFVDKVSTRTVTLNLIFE